MSDQSSLKADVVAGFDPGSCSYDFFEVNSGRWLGWISPDEITDLGANRNIESIINASCKESREPGLTLRDYKVIYPGATIIEIATLC